MSCWVIGYDICDPKRLQKVHRTMTRMACPLEYSVFLFHGSKDRIERVIERIKKLIKESVDDVRAYELPENGLQFRIGRAALPEGIVWTGMPSQWYTLENGAGRDDEEEFDEDD